MTKGKRGTKKNPITITSNTLKRLTESIKPSYIITKAKIKDDFCFYTYEIIEGIGKLDKHNVDAKSGIVKDTLTRAFATFCAHLAAIDDVFKHSNTIVDDIDKMHAHELTDLYNVSGFEIHGSDDNESIILIGSKFVSCVGGRSDFKTPKIPLDNLSSYKWYNELKTAADIAREEVRKYKEGNYIPVNDETEEGEDDGAIQLTIGSKEAMEEEEDNDTDIVKPTSKELMGDFDSAKV